MPEYIPDFNYGGDISEKDNNFKLWPTTGNMTALVDADLLPYKVGFLIDELKYMEAVNLVKDGYFKDIKSTPQFEDAFDQLCCTLNRWVKAAKCDSAILYSTKSETNFRLDIAYTSPYKGQRSGVKPPFFQELKDAMTTKLGCILADGVEADDWLSIEAWRRTNLLGVPAGSHNHKSFCDSVIISSDKDSTITPNWHLNPDNYRKQFITSLGDLIPKYKKAMVKRWEVQGTGEFWKRGEKAGQEKTKRVCVGEAPSQAIIKLNGSGLKFFYAQLIMGDAADNYIGLSGKGMTAAYELLSSCRTERELFESTLGLYKEVYGTGKHWCPIYKGTFDYYELCKSKGFEPEDWEFWKGKGRYLTAYERMLEQGRLAWMQTYLGDIWRKDKSPILDPHNKELWHDKD